MFQQLQTGQTLALINNNTKAVVILNADGSAAGFINLQQVVNAQAQEAKEGSSIATLITAIRALGLTLPAAN